MNEFLRMKITTEPGNHKLYVAKTPTYPDTEAYGESPEEAVANLLRGIANTIEAPRVRAALPATE